MAELPLRAVSPLHHPRPLESAAVAINEMTGLQMASLATGPAARPALIEAVRRHWGVDLPLTPRRVTGGSDAFLWAGPDRWMVTSSAPADLEQSLRASLGAGPAITDQTDGRCLLRVSGPKARATLAKLLPIDLHPRAFAPNHTALTVAIHVNLQIWQLDDTPAYDISLFRGYADYFHHALIEAAAEFAPNAHP